MDFYSPFNGFGKVMFVIIPVFVFIFAFAIGVVMAVLVRRARRQGKNNSAPTLTVQSVVVAKRTDSRTHYSQVNDMRHITGAVYYITFEVESGDRIELQVPGDEYGMIAEGDTGKLTFQGTRFLSFERVRLQRGE